MSIKLIIQRNNYLKRFNKTVLRKEFKFPHSTLSTESFIDFTYYFQDIFQGIKV